MKNLFIILAATFLGSFNVMAADYMAGKYEVDPAHTRVSFVIPHLSISEVEGRFNDVKGEFVLNKDFTKSTFTATIPVSTIDTGVAKRDSHLKTKDFFEVDKYPTIKITSKSVTGSEKDFKVVADVTMKDVTKAITFEGKYTGSIKEQSGAQRAALQMTGKVNRKDFHIDYDGKTPIGTAAVGDEVQIRIWSEGIKTK